MLSDWELVPATRQSFDFEEIDLRELELTSSLMLNHDPKEC